MLYCHLVWFFILFLVIVSFLVCYFLVLSVLYLVVTVYPCTQSFSMTPILFIFVIHHSRRLFFCFLFPSTLSFRPGVFGYFTMPFPLPLSTDELSSLAGQFGTPLQIYDETSIRKNCQELIHTFSSYFPVFKQFFAVKALPNPAILRVLISEGCGLDCSSKAELFIAKQVGCTGEDVMFTSNYTSKEDLKYALDLGVILNLDDISLVHDVVNISGKCPDLICFRLNPGLGHTDSMTKSNVLGGPSAKFGVPPDQILEAYALAKQHGAKRFGIHMMTGSCVMDEQYWETSTKILFETVNKLQEELEIAIEFVNVGGGLGIPYRPHENRVNIDAVASNIRNVFTRSSDGRNHSIPKLFMENGRYMTGPYGWLMTRIHVIKHAFGEKYLGVDASMANLMRPGMYNAYHHIDIINDSEPAETEYVNVVGTLCENNDWFAKVRMVEPCIVPPTATSFSYIFFSLQQRLLKKAKIGDLILIHDTGAHAHSMGFQYNGKTRAAEVLIRCRSDGEKEAFLIRKAEAIEELYHNCITPPHLVVLMDSTRS